MARFRPALHPIISTKNVVDQSTIIAATTNTVLTTIVDTVDAPTLAATGSVERGSKVHGIYLSLFIYAEGGEVANEVPLADWYIIKDQGGNMGSTFSATALPTPGATGSNDNKRFVFHEEKGLAGGGDASLAGVPMVFKGVIGVPRGYQKCNSGDRIKVCVRTNFASKLCFKAIYKWYH